MNKKKIFYLIGVVCIITAVAMYYLGKENNKFPELHDYWWIPLPLAALALLVANKK